MKNTDLAKYCYQNKTTLLWLKHISFSHKKEEQLGAVEVNNVICLPDGAKVGAGFCGGVFDKNGVPIDSSFQRFGRKTAEKLFEIHECAPKRKISGKAVFLGQYRNQWGSFLVDSVSRLWYADKNPGEYKYLLLATQEELGGIHKNAYKFLEYFGIAKEQILYINEPVEVESLIIPEMSYVPYGTHGKAPIWSEKYLETIHKVTDSVLSNFSGEDYPEKVYFSRGKFSKNQKTDFGEEMLAELMQKNGYYIVYPEEHTLEEQICYVNKCKEFASVGGSCAHNIIFSKTAPKMTLFNRMNGYQWHQWMLDEMAGVEPITYVDSYSEPYKPFFETTLSGPYLFWINKNVKSYAFDNGFALPKIGVKQKAAILTRYSLRAAKTKLSKIKRRIFK